MAEVTPATISSEYQELQRELETLIHDLFSYYEVAAPDTALSDLRDMVKKSRKKLDILKRIYGPR